MILLSSFLTYSQGKQSILDTVNLEEIIVKSVRVKEDAPITHSKLEKKDIQKRNLGQDLPIIMNFLPSVVTTTDAGAGVGYTGIRVRGSDATRVNVTINGIPYNDAESQGTFWVNLPDFSSSVEDLQMQRGVGTSTNGSGAFGASINLLTDRVSKSANAEIASSFGSFNTFKNTIKFSTGLLSDHLELSGRLSVITSDGYIDRATSDLKSYFLQATYKDENTLIKALSFGGHEITYQAWYGIDKETLETDRTFNPAGIYFDENDAMQFYDTEVDNYKQDHFQLHWTQRINNLWSTSLGLNYTIGKGYFEQYKEDQNLMDYGFPNLEIGDEEITTTDLIRRRWLDNKFYVLNANANYQNDNIDLIFGSSTSYYDGDHFGEIIWMQFAGDIPIRERYYDGNGGKSDVSFFAKATFHLNENWSVFGDLQERFVHYKTTGLNSDRDIFEVDEKYNFFNPKLGATFKINNSNHVYASYARANREPNRNDFENGINTAEKLNDYELGWRIGVKKLRINTNVYFMDYKDQLVLTGQLDDVGNPVRTTSGESYRLGLEIDANFILSKKFSIKPNLTLSSNKNLNFVASKDGELVELGKSNIAYSPNFIAANIFTYNPYQNFQINLFSKYVGKQYMGNIDSQASVLESYFVNDLNLIYEIKSIPIFKSLIITGLINNIFNVKYVSNGYFFTYDDTWSVPGETTTIEGAGYYPQAGINFLIGINLKF